MAADGNGNGRTRVAPRDVPTLVALTLAVAAFVLSIWLAIDAAPQPIAATECERATFEPNSIAATAGLGAAALATNAPSTRTAMAAAEEPAPDDDEERCTAPGELRVRVWRQGAPVVGARVAVLPGHLTCTDLFEPERPPAAEQRTDASGRAHFVGLDGTPCRLRVEDGGEHVVCGVSDGPRRPISVMFGTATVAGIVVDPDGVAVSGIGVGTMLLPLRGVATAAHTTTGSDGRFELRGLSAGLRMILVERRAGLPADDQRQVTLEEGECAEVVLGGEVASLATWSGTLRDGEGQLVPGRRRLIARNVATRDERWVTIGDGVFSASIPIGTWSLHAIGQGTLGVALGTYELTASGRQTELVWPGCRIVVTLVSDRGASIDYRWICSRLGLEGPAMGAPEGPLESPAGQYLQWLVPIGGSYRLLSGGGVHLPGDVPLAIEVASAARVHRQTVYVR